jgi:hypothetical protein
MVDRVYSTISLFGTLSRYLCSIHNLCQSMAESFCRHQGARYCADQWQTHCHSSLGRGSVEVLPPPDLDAQAGDPFLRSGNNDSNGCTDELRVSLLKFSPDGCDIVVVGTHGEILCLDSLSAATLWSIPAHLERLRQAHLCMSNEGSRVPELLLVEEHGWVCSWFCLSQPPWSLGSFHMLLHMHSLPYLTGT